MSDYLVPSGPGESELTEKRSRFLGHLRRADSEEEAKLFIAEMKKKYYDARHNCWCYIIRDSAERFSDDGEPQGSAGAPMLNVLRREGVSNAVCVVTRYFGGVLLGTGGLLRAYSKSAGDALQNAGLSTLRRWSLCSVPCSYSASERMKTEVLLQGGSVEETLYGESVTINALIPLENTERFAASVFELSSGSSRVSVTGECLRAV